ncbi:surface antigen-domain-containing protein [Lipomyces japonicus]|uniref:surface antigen-domain-containing protein n=1 Tax=Lipomyces japonicus TaxID=56871 RepID=UPI0034CF1E8D
MAERSPEQVAKDAARVRSLVVESLERNQALPVVLTSVQISGGNRTRTSFLKTHLDELVSRPYTVTSLLQALDEAAKRLESFGIFTGIKFELDVDDKAAASSSGTGVVPLVATLRLAEGASKRLRTGTDVGNGEVSGYVAGSLLNVFGGAESVTVDANIGTRTKSSYVVNFTTPLQNSPVWTAALSAVASTNEKEWSSHDEAVRGIKALISGHGVLGGRQEFGYEAFWRTVTGVKEYASTSVRSEAGDSFKSSFFNNWILDNRNDTLFPTAGYFVRVKNEVAGFVPENKGDVRFLKGEVDGQYVKSFGTNDAVTVSVSARGGVLWSLFENGKTSIVDRFVLGGANDVRGFYLNRLGPSDEEDSIGGEAYAAAGLSIFSRIPRVNPESPLRFHLFANAGSLLGLNRANPGETIKEILTKPSVTAGLGLIYKHPVARFELNLTVPLAVRQGEFPRKGLQFGIGLSFL